ncbi:Threonine/homoserine efflux transporter RhtA [Nocardioides terrae]|uniref:Threonine/homoserine efflux transporter RhtA n=1 Tax=Nocardioides terrae TaxID=574651 RepID=A0A1I1DBU7_9ACTN|nr:DMT family transporter [Nocardioides terrae]SFB71832.1 Threonine/homoserine efflux transporter RhtA [Nocardioides terrae]
MSALTHDEAVSGQGAAGQRTAAGILLALASALTFGLSGSFASSLFDTGWTPGTTALVRSAIGAAVAVPFGLAALRGRWGVLRANLGLLTAYGLLAVTGAQFCYFMAVERMEVGPALLIEYTAPAAVVGWLWARYGQRPGPVTVLGALLAASGLVLVLDLAGGASLDAGGVAWALLAMTGAATYFLVNADHSSGLPPVTLAAGGLLFGTVLMGGLALVHVLPMGASTADVVLAGHRTAWWVPVVLLGVVTCGVAYLTGVAAGRLLGARLGAFIALFEVVAGVGFAWVFVDELPTGVQLLGGLLILAGVVAVRLGEERVVASGEPTDAVED